VLYGFAIGGVGQILSGQGSRSRQNQWNAIETLAWSEGAHAIRGGIDYNRLAPSRDQIAQTVAGAYASVADVLANRPMLTSTSQADQASSLIETLALFVQDTWRVTPRLTATYGVRWELTPAPTFRSTTTQVPPIPVGPTVGTGGSLWPTRYTQFAPRAGVAYRLTPATVVRAGWGIFYDVEFGVATDPINAFPYNRWQFAGGGAAGGAGAAGAAPSGYGYAQNLKLPFSREWNVSVEHAFRGVDVVSASYVGSAGRRLLRREATLQPDSTIALTPTATNNGRSDFEALELQYRRKLAAGLQGLASYTWSHSIDNGSWDSGIYLPPTGGSNDRGASAFDVRHCFSAGLNWRAPRRWTLSTLLSARSGFPIDVLSSENFLGLSFDDFKRPNLVPGVPLWIQGRLNPAAFTIPAGSQQGNLGRNAIAGFGLGQVDLALSREFAVREESAIELRIEAFNVANHPQFGDPVRYLDSPLFGQSASMLNLMLGSGTPHSGIAPAFQVGAPRILQITARFRW
jgi:hypothetical protein